MMDAYFDFYYRLIKFSMVVGSVYIIVFVLVELFKHLAKLF